MRNFIIGLIVVVLIICGFIGFKTFYNRQLFDMTWSYEYAIICLPNGGTIEGPVDSWTDFEDGDQIKVKIEGVTYLTHVGNVVLLSE
jgi:hypothetical protein